MPEYETLVDYEEAAIEQRKKEQRLLGAARSHTNAMVGQTLHAGARTPEQGDQGEKQQSGPSEAAEKIYRKFFSRKRVSSADPPESVTPINPEPFAVPNPAQTPEQYGEDHRREQRGKEAGEAHRARVRKLRKFGL